MNIGSSHLDGEICFRSLGYFYVEQRPELADGLVDCLAGKMQLWAVFARLNFELDKQGNMHRQNLDWDRLDNFDSADGIFRGSIARHNDDPRDCYTEAPCGHSVVFQNNQVDRKYKAETCFGSSRHSGDSAEY